MSDFATSATSPRSGMKLKHILMLSTLAFIGGVGASWWAADSYGWLGADAPATLADPAKVPSNDPVVPPVAALSPNMAGPAIAADNAARAEGLLVAIAARRAIESGTPLGYLTDQLRLRFGSAEPEAVMTVLQASQAPVTVQALQSDLTLIENLLVTGAREETVWATIQREMSELFVLRKSDSPSPAPTQRMLRAHALVESGNIGGAMAEISSMPGASAPGAQNWLRRAQRYEQARQALDTLERSALAAPPALVAPVAPPAPQPQTDMPGTFIPE